MEDSMMRNLSLLAIAAVAALLGTLAHAQTTPPAAAPAPDIMPFDIPYGMPITLERAKKVAEAAIAEAKKRNWKMAVAIVNGSGDLVYFEKLDDTQIASIEIAQIKAKSAATYRRSTQVFFDAMESGHPYVGTLKGAIAAGGGMPLVENGKLIGAIGVGGGTGAQDGVVAKAGADTVK
jgi:glc operon protein GlcG